MPDPLPTPVVDTTTPPTRAVAVPLSQLPYNTIVRHANQPCMVIWADNPSTGNRGLVSLQDAASTYTIPSNRMTFVSIGVLRLNPTNP